MRSVPIIRAILIEFNERNEGSRGQKSARAINEASRAEENDFGNNFVCVIDGREMSGNFSA